MKKILLLLAILALTENCIVPFAGRQLINYDANSNAPRVRYEKQGALLLLGLLPTGSLLDLKREIDAAKQENQSKDLKNIDILYFDQNYYIIGYEKLIVNADCVK